MTFKQRLSARLRYWAFQLDVDPMPVPITGKWVMFVRVPEKDIMEYPSWRVESVRGGLVLGYIRWRNQWQAYSFVAANTFNDVAVFNAGTIADIYAFLKERGIATGRFV